MTAVEDAFGGNVDYGILVKIYDASGENETRYSPAVCLGGIPTRPSPEAHQHQLRRTPEPTDADVMCRFTA
ncbi:MAG: hypothetical protein ABJA98_26890 [Acidobacteriota bacterium]